MKLVRATWRLGVPVVIASLWLAACSTTVPVGPPNVASFVATPASIEVGSSSTLSWQVSGASSIVVTDASDAVVVDDAAATGSVDVSPTGTTVYTLTATGAGGVATEDVTVTVVPLGTPDITSFVATPSGIEVGSSSTLSWQVSGATSIVVTDASDAVVVDDAPATGSVDVSPTATTVYTLTATGGGGVATEDVTVTVVPVGAPVITSFTADVVEGSRALLTWTATGATSFDVLAVLDGDPSDVVIVDSDVTASTATVAIPASDRQRLRLVASGPSGPDATAEFVLQNVVVNPGDYDPYDLQDFTPDPEVPGTLRSVLANAPAGSVIGFASDIDVVTVFGVDVEDVGTPGTPNAVDAHLIVRDDVTISGPSGPANRVTIQGTSGYEAGVDPGDPFTYQSRLFYVMAGTEVAFENLVLTGGTFIYFGGAIRNDGNLTIASSTITDNRAWGRGGAIWNTSGAVLDIVDNSTISNNRAVTLNAEIDAVFEIRGGFPITVTESGYGGAIYNNTGGTVTVSDSVISGNEARFSGGAIYNDGTVVLVRTDVTDNVADHNQYDAVNLTLASYGGAIYNAGALQITDGDLLRNTVADQGGALYHDLNATSTFASVSIAQNLAGTSAGEIGFGGGILHRFYVGEEDRLTLPSGSFPSPDANVPENLYESPQGIRPLSASGADADERPGIFRLPAGILRDDRDR